MSQPAGRADGTEPATGPVSGYSSLKGEPEYVDLTRAQRAVVRQMVKSKTTAPHFYVFADANMTLALQLREKLKQAGDADTVPSVTDIVVKAVALALREQPRVNSSFRDDRVAIYPRVNVAIAMAAEDAVFAPTIVDADEADLAEIARRNRAFAVKVRDRALGPSDLDGATFTVSNLGMFSVDAFVSVITPPQAASLAVGRVQPKPVVGGSGELEVNPVLTLTLSCDHRVLMGEHAALFLGRVRELLEQAHPLAPEATRGDRPARSSRRQ